MSLLTISPSTVYGLQTLEATLPAGSGIDLSAAYRVLLLQTGVGGAINVILQFQVAGPTRLVASIPQVGNAFSGSEIANGVYQLVVQLPGRELRGTTPVTVRSGTPAAATPSPAIAVPSPAPAPAASPASIAAPPPAASAPPNLVPLGAAATVRTAAGNIRVPLGTPVHLNAGTGSAAPASAGDCHAHHCCCCCMHGCCQRSCCCHARPKSDCRNSTSLTPPGTQLPPVVPPPSGSPLPRVFPPAQPPGVMGPAAAGGATEEAIEAEMKVRWLVEISNPIRTGAGPELIDTSSDPALYSDMMSGTTSNGGEIPVEPVAGSPAAKDNPPVRQFDFIVSSQLLTPGNTPLPGQKITFRWLAPPGTPSLDDSQILEVGNDLVALKQKLTTQATPAGNEYAYANADGKAYAWVRVRLFDDSEIPDFDQRLIALKAIIGEAVQPPPAPGGMHTTTTHTTTTHAPTMTHAASAATRARQQRGLIDILVEYGEAAVENFGEWIDGQLESVAGIPRTLQKVLGFALRRIADGVILMFPLPGYSVALLTGFTDELRAMVAGLLLGVPRGLYAMARDSIQDLKSIAIDLPRALFNFICSDPKFALEVIGSLGSPITAQVIYQLDPEFRDRINKALSKFRGLLEFMGKILSQLWSAMRDHLTLSGISSAIGGWIYSDFEKMVGGIASDYLDYRKNGSEYRYFIGGFIGGDVLGYILSTVGVELLIAWFTAGIGNIVSALSRFGRLGAIAGRALELFHKVFTFFRAIGDHIAEFAAAAARTVKNAIGSVLIGFFKMLERFLAPVAEHLAVPFFEALLDLAAEIRKRVTEMLFRLGEKASEEGARLVYLADSLIDTLLAQPPSRPLKEFAESYLKVISKAVARSDDSMVTPYLCECVR